MVRGYHHQEEKVAVIQRIRQIIGLIRENLYSNECNGAITSWNVILLCVDQAENKATRMGCTFFRGSLYYLNDLNTFPPLQTQWLQEEIGFVSQKQKLFT